MTSQSCCHHQLWIKISLVVNIVCATKKRVRNQKPTKGNGRNRDSQRNGIEETEGARYGAEIVD